MSMDSQLAELVAAFAADLERLLYDVALEAARERLGDDVEKPAQRKAAPRQGRPVKPPAPAAPAPEPAAPPAAAAAPAAPVDPWMRPLRPGVLETLDVRRKRRRTPKRKAEPARAPIPREPIVRSRKVDDMTIIPADDTEEAPLAPLTLPKPVEAPPEPAPAAAGAEPARKWVVVRRPARDKQEPVEGDDDSFHY
jgi:hypothetical protein